MTASAQTAPPRPVSHALPIACQDVPSQRATRSARTPPAVSKLPPAMRSPFQTVSANTHGGAQSLKPVPCPPSMPPPKGCHDVPSQRAMQCTLSPEAVSENEPPAMRSPWYSVRVKMLGVDAHWQVPGTLASVSSPAPSACQFVPSHAPTRPTAWSPARVNVPPTMSESPRTIEVYA